MKVQFLALTLILAAATCARGGTPGYIECGTYDSYLLLYRSIDKFEELGKLRCSEKVEILAHVPGYYEIRVADGRVGWVLDGDLSTAPPPPHHTFTFGMTDPVKPATPASPSHAAPSGALTTEDVLALRNNPGALAALPDKIKSSPCDFDTSPLAIRRLRSAGIPDKVILAMLAAPVAGSGQGSDSAGVATAALRIPKEISLDFHVTRDVPGEGLLDGAVIELTADEDLVVHGALIVVKGATARARVLGIRQPGAFNPGQMAWFMQDVSTVGGGTIPAVFDSKQPGKMHTKVLDGYPFFLTEFDKGKPAIRAAHTSIRGVIIPGSVFLIPQAPASNAPAPLQAKEQSPPATAKPEASAADPQGASEATEKPAASTPPTEPPAAAPAGSPAIASAVAKVAAAVAPAEPQPAGQPVTASVSKP